MNTIGIKIKSVAGDPDYILKAFLQEFLPDKSLQRGVFKCRSRSTAHLHRGSTAVKFLLTLPSKGTAKLQAFSKYFDLNTFL